MPGLKRSLPTHANSETDRDDDRRAVGDGVQKRIRLSEERSQDDDSEDETDEEIQNLQATQLHEKQKSRRQQQNGPAENGIIENVTMVNFMCHGFLHMDIGPNINFIIGHNGSGKSAVLTAITICLGGKASATNRASSLKSFIKEGTETCNLSVKIRNGGDDGYQQELYGDSIGVERTFSRSGASAFKLKSANGRIISTKRGDLDDITDYYALQLDNPINVLTQDNARQFLSGSGPTEKYKFFIKGVQLEQLNRDYDLLHENIALMEATFEDKRSNLRRLKEAREQAKVNYDLLNQDASLYSRIHHVRAEVAWEQVEGQEREFQQAEDDLVAVAAELEATRDRVAEATRLLSDADQAREEAQTQRDVVDEEVKEISAELEKAKKGQDDLKNEAKAAQADERAIGEDIRVHKSSIGNTEHEIETEKSRLEEVNGGSIARLMEELEEKKAAVEQRRQRHRHHNAGRADILKEQSDIEEEQRLCDQRRKSKIGERASCDNRVRDLRNQGQRRSYKPNMDKLIDAIAASRDFREKPIGPIGDHVQLKDAQWLSVLERTFGDMLEAFIVTSKSDQARLADMMRRVKCQTSVVIGNRTPIDTSSHEPDPQFETILRVLKIDNEVVKRQLVISQGIEQTILIPSIKEAREIMDRSRLSNVKQCFSHQPHSPNAGERFNYGIGGALNSSFIQAWGKLPRMKTQVEDSIAYEWNFLQRLEREVGETNEEMQKLKSKATTCRQMLAGHDKQERSLKADTQSAQHECDELQEKIDANSIEEGKLDALKRTLLTLEEELAHDEKVRISAAKEREKQTAKWKATQPQITGLEGRKRVADSQLKNANQKLRKCDDTRQSTLFQKNGLHEALADLERRQASTQAERDELETRVADFAREASTVGERVPIPEGETADSLDKKLEKLENDLINHQRRVGGSREEITRVYETASTAYANAFTLVETEEKLAQLLRHSLNNREERWKLFRQKISARARATFVFVLSERSFHGHLRINHARRKLEIAVQPDETQRDRSGREASSLSGGEKSYSTICLLLSLWDAVGAPIRCLDEFDVYMDSVNREISMKLLVRAARNAVGRQFILISPQAGIMDSSPDVKIIKLQDPERNQTRLALGSGT